MAATKEQKHTKNKFCTEAKKKNCTARGVMKLLVHFINVITWSMENGTPDGEFHSVYFQFLTEGSRDSFRHFNHTLHDKRVEIIEHLVQ